VIWPAGNVLPNAGGLGCATGHIQELAVRFTAFLAATLAGLTGLAPATSAAKGPPVCTGTDMVAERLAADDPIMREAVKAAKAIPNDGAVLWKLEKDGKPTSYLFGTIHSTDPRVTRLTPELASAIADVDTVALELTKGSEQDMVRLMMSAPGTFFFTDGTSLGDKLSAERIGKLRKAVAGTGLPIDNLRPWMASMMLAVSACERRRMGAAIPVLDSAVEARARKLGKTVVALESVELQVNAMSGLPMADQIPQLQLAIDLYDRADDLGETIKRLYLDRRIGLVWTMNLAIARERGISEDRFKAFETALIDQRNRDMAAKALAMMETKPVLVAVGALHLVGKSGLVALAKEAGFTATPLN
jgi:uncharacterized protein YbaP (TraB family)